MHGPATQDPSDSKVDTWGGGGYQFIARFSIGLHSQIRLLNYTTENALWPADMNATDYNTHDYVHLFTITLKRLLKDSQVTLTFARYLFNVGCLT